MDKVEYQEEINLKLRDQIKSLEEDNHYYINKNKTEENDISNLRDEL